MQVVQYGKRFKNQQCRDFFNQKKSIWQQILEPPVLYMHLNNVKTFISLVELLLFIWAITELIN